MEQTVGANNHPYNLCCPPHIRNRPETVRSKRGSDFRIVGHSDLSTTQIYLDSFENSQIDEAMQHLL